MLAKSKRIMREFWDHTDSWLRGAEEKLDAYCDRHFHKQLMMTCVVRTPKENEKEKGEARSKHLLKPSRKWCAIDNRIANENHSDTSRWLTLEETEELQNYFYDGIYEKRGDAFVIEDDHFHLQCAVRDKGNDQPYYVIGTVE